jgi:transketolase
MHVVCPADPIEVKLALADALRLEAPTYIRLGKKGEPIVHQTEPHFEIGKGICLREGSDITLLSVGNMLADAMLISENLNLYGVSAEVISMHTIKPLDQLLLQNIFINKKLIVVMEEHALIGGASSAILEWGCDQGVNLSKMIRFGGPDQFLFACGGQMQARELIGLTSENITKKILNRLK